MSDLALPGVHVTDTSLEFLEQPDFERWQQVGETLHRIEGAVMWWIGDWYRAGEFSYGDKAAQAVGGTSELAPQTVSNAAWVSGAIESSRRREDLKWGHHASVAALDPGTQDELLDEAEAKKLSVHDLRDRVRRLKRPATPQPPAGEYQLVYADPPWRYEFAESNTREVENQYDTMSLDEIKALRVPAADDSMLFLWATSPKLEEAMEVVSAWGFTYRTCAVWVKDRIGMGYYLRQQHELLLIGRRGDVYVPEPETRVSSVIEAPRGEHSAKPPQVYELIEGMYPDLTKIELFARTERPGWAAWGNEAAA